MTPGGIHVYSYGCGGTWLPAWGILPPVLPGLDVMAGELSVPLAVRGPTLAG